MSLHVGLADYHDGRFLAYLDFLVYEGAEREQYAHKQNQFWAEMLPKKELPRLKVFVAKNGPLYLGYAALLMPVSIAPPHVVVPQLRNDIRLHELLIEATGYNPTKLSGAQNEVSV